MAKPPAFCHPERRARSARSRRTSLVEADRSGGGVSGLGGARRPAGARRRAKAPARLRRGLVLAGRDPRKSGGQGPMGRYAHRSCCLWFYDLRVRLTKPPRIAGLAGWGLVAPAAGARAAGRTRPAAIGAGFVRLAAGRTHVRPAGARGWRARKNAIPVQKARSGNEGTPLDAGAASTAGPRSGKTPARPPGGRLRGVKPPPPAPEAPRLRPRPQFLNRHGRIWVQPRPPQGSGFGQLGLRPAARRRVRPIGRTRNGKAPSVVKTRLCCRYRKRLF